MNPWFAIPRRTGLKYCGLFGSLPFLGAGSALAVGKAAPGIPPVVTGKARRDIFKKVFSTPLIDTHEHLPDEKERLAGTVTPGLLCDDWAVLFFPYLCDDMMVAGMPPEDWSRFFSKTIDPLEKWKILEPYWPAIKNTGYGRAVCIAFQHLYGVDDLSQKTIKAVQAGYERVRKPGFYQYILRDLGGIESCQVNSIVPPFKETSMPGLLMQDLSFLGMTQGPEIEKFAGPAGIPVSDLAGWRTVMEWWFEKYGKYAVAVKSQNAYSRDIDYNRVPPEKVEYVFKKTLLKQPVSAEEKKALEDHLFWYAAELAGKYRLPVKLHTGYYVGHDYMPLNRVANNPDSAAALCRNSPKTPFVFMHLGYPYYEPMLALAKQYTNAYIDMCWGWIINPIAAKDFLKKFLVTVPSRKIFTFGGDYYPVEPVLGHALIARRGIALALSELVEEGWLPLRNAMELIDPIMHENARKVFRLEEKKQAMEQAPWL